MSTDLTALRTLAERRKRSLLAQPEEARFARALLRALDVVEAAGAVRLDDHPATDKLRDALAKFNEENDRA